MAKKPPTIRDVAAAANVSTATVSKFINGAQKFSPTVEATLRAVIEELGYRSNPFAQSMITGKTKAIGLSILDVSNPHFTSIVKGVNRIATEHGYTVLLVDMDENIDREKPLLEALSRRVDGMIIFSRLAETQLDWITKLGKPIVFFGRLTHLSLPSVGSDDHLGAYMLAKHLVSLGHKRIAYLGFDKSRRNEERMEGIRACLTENKLSLETFNSHSPSTREGERLCSSIMMGATHPDALICYNDLLALGFMKAAQSFNFDIPKDISVAGFDNIEYGRYTSPTLTTVDLQSESMGIEAMKKLLLTIDGDQNNDFTMVEPQLILRSSTAKK